MQAAKTFERSGAMRSRSMSLALDDVVRALRGLGVLDDEVFRTVLVENPARWLTAWAAFRRARAAAQGLRARRRGSSGRGWPAAR